MTDHDTQESPTARTSTSPIRTDRIVFSVEDFDRLRARRFKYMLFYGVAFVGWLTASLVIASGGGGPNRGVIVASGMAIAVATLIPFYINFVRVANALRYSPWIILAVGLLALMPVPGMLALILLDRQIFHMVDKALKASERT